MTSAEQNYTQIEKELLAIVFGCERFNMYTYGADIDVITDHKPLESIFKKTLAQGVSPLTEDDTTAPEISCQSQICPRERPVCGRHLVESLR